MLRPADQVDLYLRLQSLVGAPWARPQPPRGQTNRQAPVLKKVFLPKDAGAAVPEKELIKQGMKWWPTKGYRRVLPAEGHGVSSEWQIEVSSLRRSQVDFPAEGIPFCLVVTISDPDRQASVFQEMRRGLGSQLVQLGDLLTTQRVRPGG